MCGINETCVGEASATSHYATLHMKSPRPSSGQCMNANVHLRIVVVVRIAQGRMKAFYPKVRGGLKALWMQKYVK